MNAGGRNNKIFTDAVHGHIRIPTPWCESIIDTPHFQRLRRIEQSFVSTLYPSATHNRFTHSIGVYHVGTMLLRGLEQNCEHFKSILELMNGERGWEYLSLSRKNVGNVDFYTVLSDSFLVACLLHDCGHSPFSHTFEEYYIYGKNEDNILKDMQSCATRLSHSTACSCSFMKDIKERLNAYRINPHELVSAWLVLEQDGFAARICSSVIHADPLLAARMITGTCFTPLSADDAKICSILNSYIGLLNGNIVDADRIDYSLRDQWATGNNSSVFNVRRLIDSITLELHEDEYVVCYDKRCLSELHFIHEIKNRNSFWVFSHHKFKLLEDSIKNAVIKLALLMSVQAVAKRGKTADKKLVLQHSEYEALAELFDYKTLIRKKDFHFYVGGCQPSNCHSESLIYTSDDDIIHLLKKYFSVVEESHAEYKELLESGHRMFHEWQSRQSKYMPLWKSYYEYREICYNGMDKKLKEFSAGGSNDAEDGDEPSQQGDNRYTLDDYIEILKKTVKKTFNGAEPRIIPTDFKVSDMQGGNVYIKMHGRLVRYAELAIPTQNTNLKADDFFYCFITLEEAQQVCGASGNDLYTKCALRLKDAIENLTQEDIFS